MADQVTCNPYIVVGSTKKAQESRIAGSHSTANFFLYGMTPMHSFLCASYQNVVLQTIQFISHYWDIHEIILSSWTSLSSENEQILDTVTYITILLNLLSNDECTLTCQTHFAGC